MAGNKEFSLLTKLTLDAAGFNTGIDQAKQKTKDLSKGTEQAANTIKGSFGSLSGMFSGLTGSLSGIQGAVMGGIGAFKSMVPAISSVKVAFMSTGIGAIVIALAGAFASLSSYLGSTKEGANGLKNVFAYISGAIQAILNRVQLLGSAIWKLLKGDWAGMKEEFSKAFAGGLLDEIKNTAEKNLDIQKREIALAKEKRALGYEEADELAKSAELREKSRDFENYSMEERLKYLNEAFALEKSAGEKKTDIAHQEYLLLVEKNKLKKFASKEDSQAELDAYTNFRMIEAAKFESMRSFFREKKKLMDALHQQDIESELYMESLQRSQMKNTIGHGGSAIGGGSLLTTGRLASPDMEGFISSDAVSKTRELNIAMNELIGTNQEFSNSFKIVSGDIGFFGATITQAFGAAMKAMSAGGKSLREIVSNGANAAKEIIAQNLAMAASKALSAVTAIPFPLNIVAAAVSVAGIEAIGASIKFANGGIVPGTSYSGDQVHAMVNSGEMVLNAGQQANLFDMIKSGAGGGGEVVFRIDGTQLVGVLNNYNRKVRNIG